MSKDASPLYNTSCLKYAQLYGRNHYENWWFFAILGLAYKMKGTMLVAGETFADRKADLLEYIKVCRTLIATINNIIKRHPDWDNDLAYEVMKAEQDQIKDTMAELIELQKWYNNEGKYKEVGYKDV